MHATIDQMTSYSTIGSVTTERSKHESCTLLICAVLTEYYTTKLVIL
jgi:hypothetical protein